jgi:hypothetical protein
MNKGDICLYMRSTKMTCGTCPHKPLLDEKTYAGYDTTSSIGGQMVATARGQLEGAGGKGGLCSSILPGNPVRYLGSSMFIYG